MKYIFIFILGIGVIALIGTYSNTDKIPGTAILNSAIGSRTKEIRNSIQEKVIPKDPIEKRAVLISELKSNIEELKNRNENNPQGNNQSQKLKEVSTSQLIKESEDIISELENSNNDKTVGQKITEKVLDNIFPLQEKESRADCKN